MNTSALRAIAMRCLSHRHHPEPLGLQPPQLPLPPPHTPTAATGTARLPQHSRYAPQRSDLLLYLPGRQVVVDVCVGQPLASSAVVAAARGLGASVEAKDVLKRDTCGRAGPGANRFIPLSHQTHG